MVCPGGRKIYRDMVCHCTVAHCDRPGFQGSASARYQSVAGGMKVVAWCANNRPNAAIPNGKVAIRRGLAHAGFNLVWIVPASDAGKSLHTVTITIRLAACAAISRGSSGQRDD